MLPSHHMGCFRRGMGFGLGRWSGRHTTPLTIAQPQDKVGTLAWRFYSWKAGALTSLIVLPPARSLRSIGLGGEHSVQVLAGLGIVRIQFQSLLKLADRLPGAALLVPGAAQVIVRLGVVGFRF